MIEREFKTATSTISALCFGSPDSYPIIATHGWLDNAASFIPLSEYLNDFYLIAIDLPGHGNSSHPPSGTYFHFIDYMPILMNLIEVLEYDECALLGHSLGAGIASMITGTIPEKIKSLACIDAFGPLVVKPALLPKLVKTAVQQYGQLGKKMPPFYESLDDAINARHKASDMKINSVELLVNRGIKEQNNGYAWKTDQRLLFKPIMMFTEDQVEPFLTNIECPTTLIKSKQGWPFDEKIYKKRINHVPHMINHEVEGGHHVHMDSPEVIGPLLKEFFKKSLAI